MASIASSRPTLNPADKAQVLEFAQWLVTSAHPEAAVAREIARLRLHNVPTPASIRTILAEFVFNPNEYRADAFAAYLQQHR